MGSTATGEIFDQAQVDAMSPKEREQHGLRGITQKEAELLEAMPNRKERRKWLRENKKLSRRKR